MNERAFVTEYFRHFTTVMQWDGLLPALSAARRVMEDVRASGRKVVLAGNGASASIASHYALDFTKQAGVRAIAFNDAPLLTAYGNDYGFEHWLAKAVEHHGDPGDAAILISTSGRSVNMVRAAEACRSRGLTILTFTGFDFDNPLRGSGNVNFWTDSRSYNVVEAVHAVWLGVLCDMLVGDREYSVDS